MRFREFMRRLNLGEILMAYVPGRVGYTLYCAMRRGDRIYPYQAIYSPGKPLRVDMFKQKVSEYAYMADVEVPEVIRPLHKYLYIFTDPEASLQIITEGLQQVDDEQDFVRGFREDDYYFYADTDSAEMKEVHVPLLKVKLN